MDYGSVMPSGGMLAATGFGIAGGLFGQLWLVGLAAIIMVGVVLIVRTRFRRDKSPEDV